jgi:uncharacterized protein YkwD
LEVQMRRVQRFAVSSLLAFSAVGAAPAIANACSGANSTPAQMSANAAKRATLCLLNRERRAHGLRALRLDGKLGRAARGHARDMVAQRYFSHDSRNGASFSTRIKRTGWTRSRRSYTMGENIGWGGGSLSTPRAMVQAWMNSAGHRANILSRSFNQIGIGIANGAPTGGSGATYATDFGG